MIPRDSKYAILTPLPSPNIDLDRVQKFAKNLGSTSEFYASEGWHVASFVLTTDK